MPSNTYCIHTNCTQTYAQAWLPHAVTNLTPHWEARRCSSSSSSSSIAPPSMRGRERKAVQEEQTLNQIRHQSVTASSCLMVNHASWPPHLHGDDGAVPFSSADCSSLSPLPFWSAGSCKFTATWGIMQRQRLTNAAAHQLTTKFWKCLWTWKPSLHAYTMTHGWSENNNKTFATIPVICVWLCGCCWMKLASCVMVWRLCMQDKARRGASMWQKTLHTLIPLKPQHECNWFSANKLWRMKHGGVC